MKHVLAAALLLVGGSASLAQPQVSLVWPDSSSRYTIGLYLKMKAVVTSSNAGIVRVEFLGDTNLLGVVTNAPFNFVWNVGSGFGSNLSYVPRSFSAVATDSLGRQATSASVRPIFYGGAIPSPIVAITSPPNGAIFTAPATFPVVAELLASTGDTGPEEFFLGTNSLGIVNTNGLTDTFTVDTPPVSVTVSNLTEGDYTLRVAYLGANGCFCSSVTIQVVKLAAVSPTITADGRFRFDVVTTFPGVQHIVEVSTNLKDCTPISTNTPSDASFTFTNSDVANATGFYRVFVPQTNNYSANIVGYVNLSVPQGYSLLSNPLSAGQNNGANELGLQISGEQILTWNGSAFDFVSFDASFGGWIDANFNQSLPPSLPPGTGFFLYNPGAATNITFVGNVVPGPSRTNYLSLHPGFSLLGSPLPASVTNIGSAPVSLPLIADIQVLTWSGSGYVFHSYIPEFGGWVDANLNPMAAPGYSIGQGFLFFDPNGGFAGTWVQSLP